MASMKVLAGDFGETKGHYFSSAKAFTITRAGGWGFNADKVSLAEVASIELATEESVKRAGGTIGWGAAGAVILGPVGLLAGLLLGGKGKDATFVCVLKDGRKFMATTDSKTFTQIQAGMF